MENKKIEFFNKLSFNILLATIFASFFFFIPYSLISLEMSKGFLISIGVSLSVFFWLISVLARGNLKMPKDKLISFAIILPLVFLLSAIFSLSKNASLFGNGFEIGTFGSILTLSLLFFLSSIFFQNSKRLGFYLGSIFIAGLVIIVFQILNIFIGFENIFPGILQGMAYGNLVGTWNNFALIIGLIILLSLSTLELLQVEKLYKIILYTILFLGLLLLVIVNFKFVWILIFLFSILLFIYNTSVRHSGIVFEGDKNKFKFLSLIVVFISLIFLIGGSLLNNSIYRYISLNSSEVRPSISTTSTIAYQSLKHNPLLGTGPNTFMINWSMWQPKEIAQTTFWNVDFDNSYSIMTTFVISTGILGLFALLLFLIIYVFRGLQSIKIALEDKTSNYFIITILLISFYSWITIILFNPNIIMLMLAFSSSGLLLGVLVSKKAIPEREFSFSSNSKKDFLTILSLLVVLIFSFSLSYIYLEKFASIVYFSKGLYYNNTVESLSRSEKMLLKAITLNKNDVYYRNLSQLYINQIDLITKTEGISEDNLKSSLQQLINLSQESAKLAVRQNPKLYLNYLNLGNIYSSLVPLSVTYSYESALNAYNQAMELAPNNPLIVYNIAMLEFLNKNNQEARNNITKALELKSNYVDAIFLLVQIESEEGNLTEAIKQAEYATTLAPNDSTVFFRLGLLRFYNKNYQGAIDSFERSVILNNNYLNARFFLAQSYKNVGRKNDALVQFNILKEILPDNQEINDAIRSINLPSTATPTITDDDGDIKLPIEENL
jgi:tetratricopeptide (TPR) repeat protein